MIVSENDLPALDLLLIPGDTVFLSGDLGAGKTTLVRSLIGKLSGPETIVRSPTYTYFSTYAPNIYHFDLYRIEDYETFINIGAEDIFADPTAIRFVEWPELLEGKYAPTIRITLKKIPEDEHLREITIEKNI